MKHNDDVMAVLHGLKVVRGAMEEEKPITESDEDIIRTAFVIIVNINNDADKSLREIIPVMINYGAYPDKKVSEYHWNTYIRNDNAMTNTILEYGGGMFFRDEEGELGNELATKYSKLVCNKIVYNRGYKPEEIAGISIISMIMFAKNMSDEIKDDEELAKSIKSLCQASLIDEPIFATFFMNDIEESSQMILANPNTDNEAKKAILRVLDARKRANLYD